MLFIYSLKVEQAGALTCLVYWTFCQKNSNNQTSFSLSSSAIDILKRRYLKLYKVKCKFVNSEAFFLLQSFKTFRFLKMLSNMGKRF